MSRPGMEIDLVTVDDTLSTQALRAVLESWNISVRVHWIGSARDLVRVLGNETSLAPVVVLMCHGSEHGLALPQLHPGIEQEQPYHLGLTPSDLRQFLSLPECFVLNTGCSLGTPDYAQAFLDSGCRAYIGATGDPDGPSSLFYALHFFYELICRSKPLREAHKIARSHDHETAMYQLYEQDPGELSC